HRPRFRHHAGGREPAAETVPADGKDDGQAQGRRHEGLDARDERHDGRYGRTRRYAVPLMQEMPPPAVSAWVDGAPATADQLRTLAIANYGHFTSMQVHQRAVRGLDLHLQRLHVATQALFDVGLDPVRVRRGLLQALAAAGLADASARVTVFAP